MSLFVVFKYNFTLLKMYSFLSPFRFNNNLDPKTGSESQSVVTVT